MAPRLRLVSSLAAAGGGGARCWHAAWDAEGGALLTAGSDRAVRVWRARGAAAGAAQVRALARAAGPLHALAPAARRGKCALQGERRGVGRGGKRGMQG